MQLLNFYKLPLYYAKAVILILEIEKNLSRYIRREYEKLESQDKQRSFIENFRFLMMSSDTDFQNFYSKRSLNDREFYSIVDSLYQLNNLCMLAEFVSYTTMYTPASFQQYTPFSAAFRPCRFSAGLRRPSLQ